MDKVTNWFAWKSIRKGNGGQEETEGGNNGMMEHWKNGVLEYWSDGVLERGEDCRLSTLRSPASGGTEDGRQGFRLRYSYPATRRRGEGDRIERNGRMEYWSIGVMEYWEDGMMGKEKSLPASPFDTLRASRFRKGRRSAKRMVPTQRREGRGLRERGGK